MRDYDQVADELDAAREGQRVQVVRVADVEARELEPLWPGVIWVGKPTLLVGDPGLSKSTMVCDVVACVTRRREWPCSVGKTIDGDVLMLSAEDDVADTLRPRLEAAGADLHRVHFLESVIVATNGTAQRHSWPSLVEHIGALDEWLKVHPAVRLLVVAPLAAYLTGADTHKQSEVRAVLGALAQIASRYRVAVLAVMHLNKGSGGNPLYRASGSVENGLLCQARTLDRIFYLFVRRACREGSAEYRDLEFRIAFRAQSHYRANLATLAAIKNPARVAYVNQANIANGPQQVNNGCTVRNGSGSRRKTKNRPSKLSGRKRELLPNPRASAVKSDADPETETLGAVHGTKDGRG
jgi:RecA-family ATPase